MSAFDPAREPYLTRALGGVQLVAGRAGAPPEGGVVTNPMRVMPERRAEAMTLASVS